MFRATRLWRVVPHLASAPAEVASYPPPMSPRAAAPFLALLIAPALGCASGAHGVLSINHYELEHAHPDAPIPIGVGSTIEIATWWQGECTPGRGPNIIERYEGVDGDPEVCKRIEHTATARCVRGCTAAPLDDASDRRESHRISIVPAGQIGEEIEFEVTVDSGKSRQTLHFPHLRTVVAELEFVCGDDHAPPAPCAETAVAADGHPYVKIGSENTPFVIGARVNGAEVAFRTPIPVADLVLGPVSPAVPGEPSPVNAPSPRAVPPGYYQLAIEVGPPDRADRSTVVIHLR